MLMGLPCLEFALVEGAFDEFEADVCMADPMRWDPLPEHVYAKVEEAGAEPGWQLSSFTLWLESIEMVAYCYERERASDDTWLYTLAELGQEGQPTYVLQSYGLAVREVPACLVFNCHLAIIQDHTFRAQFSLVSGQQIFSLEEDLQEQLIMGYLVWHARVTAEEAGYLKSRNQAVHVLLNGSTAKLKDHVLLWSKSRPIGWLQQG